MNKTILTLVWVLLVVSVFTTVTFVNKANELTGGVGFLTGAAVSSSTGQTNITITATTSLTLGMAQINFGAGYVNGSCTFCVLDLDYRQPYDYFANGSIVVASSSSTACCKGDFNTTVGNHASDGFTLENTGNVNVSVGYTCAGNCTHALFLGGTLDSTMGGLELKVFPASGGASVEQGVSDTVQSCQGGGSYYRDSNWNITNQTSYTNVAFAYSGNNIGGTAKTGVLSSRGHWLCGNYTHSPLMPDNEKDAGLVAINLTIPANAPGTGVRSSFTLTFNATSQ